MIQFPPLESRNNYDAILELYFYMIAMVMPFPAEDIFPSDSFYEYGDISKSTFTVKSFYLKSGKNPRRRNIIYKALLRDYGINESLNLSRNERFKNDAYLAKLILKKAFVGVPENKSLYDFLYKGLPQDDFHVNREHLHLLLTAYMDENSLEHYGLGFECIDSENLSEIFRYSKFADLSDAIKLMDLLEVPVCPYCNRNFTSTVSKDNGIRQGQFDHYRSKSKYPWFSLSLYNLIPTCGYCNQSKSDKSIQVLYPYKESMSEYYCFKTKPVHGVDYLTGNPSSLNEFTIVGEKGPIMPTSEQTEHIQNSLEIFHLNELYNTHHEHIAWIFRQRYIFSDTYLLSLCQAFPTLFSSIQEVRDMLYMCHISPEHWGEHPLSKLTHDIDKEITELEQYSFQP